MYAHQDRLALLVMLASKPKWCRYWKKWWATIHI